MSHELKSEILLFVSSAARFGRPISLDLDISAFGQQNEIDIGNAVRSMAQRPRRHDAETETEVPTPSKSLPRKITFPYSRHSSYPELCHLVEAFQPKDIWPCTVDEAEWRRSGKY